MPRKRIVNPGISSGITPPNPSQTAGRRRKKAVALTNNEVDIVQEPARLAQVPERAENVTIRVEIPMTRNEIYIRAVKNSEYFICENLIIFPECDEVGNIPHSIHRRKYRLIQHTEQQHGNGGRLICDCTAGDILGSECIHVSVAKVIYPAYTQLPHPADNDTCFLREKPLLLVIIVDSNPGVLSRNVHRMLECNSCQYGKHSCTHIRKFKVWCDENNLVWSEVAQGVYEERGRINNKVSLTTRKIPFPLSDELKYRYISRESGQNILPAHLIPPSTGSCENGYEWHDGENTEQIIGPCHIHKSSSIQTHTFSAGTSTLIQSYFKECVGPCKCQKFYDGQEEQIFNYNNFIFVDYGLLFSYMFLMIESRNPLAAFHRAHKKTLECFGIPRSLSYDVFKQVWQDFSNLLDIDWVKLFTCQHCVDMPEIVVCDGTSVGYRRNRYHQRPQMAPDPDAVVIEGLTHKDWIFIGDNKTRKLLLRYSGINKGSAKETRGEIVGITPDEFIQLQATLNKEKRKCLVALIKSNTCKTQLTSGNLAASEMYRPFLQDIGRNTPVQSLLQGGQEVMRIVDNIIEGLNLFDPANHEELKNCQTHLPMISNFLSKTQQHGRMDKLSVNLIKEIVEIYKVCQRKMRVYDPLDYGEISETEHSFFPRLGVKHGRGKYKIDSERESVIRCREDTCRKMYTGHPTLTPGIFTIFCEHGICYGFVSMEECESPRMPFDIFLRRFPRAPKMIIYDNSCKLHQYSLHREPSYFAKTVFVSDRMHWRNHTACSSGYNMNNVRSINVKKINSQVNEQANAGLKRIKAQTSYMKVDKFMRTVALFLAIKNMAKRGDSF